MNSEEQKLIDYLKKQGGKALIIEVVYRFRLATRNSLFQKKMIKFNAKGEYELVEV